ncbi:MAG: hypothetical protein II681_06665 [Bacteroidaceae bacterium]|nr:hypothetical protein [Bacteroidaceae bacterium]MBQ2460697.1 hypothetical protein [Bacteroidaceae bacterium]MBQ2519365.1 hypothetical protein [Bacteroidaceae bacterium]MBQ2595076.1 hypothetical protein [Bacteroidaceae bacterium]MBQ3958521.1 hypothetical protein [Bacteroidaceae bacterium]
MKENLQKNAGIILIALGALMLMVSYFTKDWVDYNWYQLVCLLLIIGGIVAHIVISKKN